MDISNAAGIGFISIHPPRGGRDSTEERASRTWPYFNPPSPWGEGPPADGALFVDYTFQSTLPVGGGTPRATLGTWMRRFQSTLPVGGGTAKVHKNSFLFHALPTNSLAFFVTTSCFLGENQKTGGEFLKISVRRSQGNPGRFPLAPV